MLSAYIFMCYILLMSWPFIIQWPPLSLVTAFELKSVFSDISVATPALFWFPLAWNIFFHFFNLSLCVSLKLEWIFCRQHIVRSFFFFLNHSATLCLMIWEFNPFTFRLIIESKDLQMASNFFWLFCSSLFLSSSFSTFLCFFKIYLFNFFLKFLFLSALGLHCCARTFSSCGEQELLFIAVRGLLIAVASLVAEHGL